MRRIASGLSLVVFISLAGCSSSPLPPVEQIVQIRITVTRMPDEVEHRKTPAVANLKERADIAEVMDWLSAIDWSQRGTDMAVIGIPQADGGITIETKAGESQSYGFYWDGKFTLTKANRLIQSRDVAKLKQIVQRHCK
jgi:hypothetical protein